MSNQQAESECYLYPGSYRDPVDVRDLKEKAEKESCPPLPPRPPAAIATRGEHFAAPVAMKPMAPPSVRLDPGIPLATGTGSAGMGTPGVYGSIDLTHDPRTHSTQSIPPAPAPPAHQRLPQRTPSQLKYQAEIQQQHSAPLALRRRKLLLVYIHGFRGSTTSFNHYPSHLHNLLTYLLATSCPQYTVHTKVYPRFKTRHAIGEAAEMFSQWLSDFEDEDEVPGRKALRPGYQQGPAEETDIIILGHSMGGLLAGEVVLLPRMHPVETDVGARRYRHRILGVVGFDTPFVGMHPGVVTSGISSLFRPSPKPEKRKETAPLSPTGYEDGPSAEDLFLRKNPEHFDTGFAPRYEGGNRGIMNFLTKHNGNIPGATMQYVMSHMEFAACLADPKSLYSRYKRLRALEDGKDLAAPGGTGAVGGYRVRFVNYYTACYGREKEEKKEKEKDKVEEVTGTPKIDGEPQSPEKVPLPMSPPAKPQHRRDMSTASVTSIGTTTSISTTATTDEHRLKVLDLNGVSPPSTPGGSPRSSTSSPPPIPPPHLVPVVHRPMDAQEPSPAQTQAEQAAAAALAHLNARSQRYSLPNIPPPPVAPPLHADLSHITDQKLQKVHMKENKSLWKEHFRQEKAHAKLIKEREKVLAKLEKEVAESPKPSSKDGIPKEKTPERHDAEKLKKKDKVKKERKFCLVPKEAKSADGGLGEEGVAGEGYEGRDDTWVKVPMGNIDEVAAHCGLFMAGAEIFETRPKSQGVGAGVGGGDVVPHETLMSTGTGRISIDNPLPHPHPHHPPSAGQPPKDDEEQLELDGKRRQYERLVGDLAERIEGWVKEHVGRLEAIELAGEGMGMETQGQGMGMGKEMLMQMQDEKRW